MAGRSVGGSSTIPALLSVRAGIDIDGTTDMAIPEGGPSRPFMVLGKPSTYSPGQGDAAATWSEAAHRVEAPAPAVGGGAPVVHGPRGAGRSARHRRRRRHPGRPRHGGHPRLTAFLDGTCAASTGPCSTGRRPAIPRSRSAPRRTRPAGSSGAPVRAAAPRRTLRPHRLGPRLGARLRTGTRAAARGSERNSRRGATGRCSGLPIGSDAWRGRRELGSWHRPPQTTSTSDNQHTPTSDNQPTSTSDNTPTSISDRSLVMRI